MNGSRRIRFLLSALALAAVSWGVLATPGTAAAAKALKRSPDGVWTLRSATAGGRTAPGVALNARALARILAGAPSEAAAAAGARRPVLSLPLPEGGFARFRIEKSPIFSAAVQKRFRSIKTYRGRGVDDPTATARMDVTPLGFHAQILSSAGTVLVDPAAGIYRSVRIQGLAATSFPCGSGEKAVAPLLAPAAAPSGDSVREYRLAVVGTGEFAVGSDVDPNARIVTMVNRAIGIYEREVAVRFTLLPPIIFTDPGSDQFATGSVVDNNLLTQNQAVLDGMVGSANYDIGHVVTLGSGGGLALGTACAPGLKGQGGTALSNPADESFDVEAFSHVIGHQLGAHHTFNGTTDACGPERNAGTAYEPGSGSTIMSFAGLCGAENVQTLADTYFHTASFDEITAFRDGVGACGSVADPIPTNHVPVVDGGLDYTIPRGTPFTLTAIGSDLDPDALTFCWEQFDLGVLPPNDVFDPLFRSLPPSASPARTFPAMADLLSGTTSEWERLPQVDRMLKFRVTVRDNRTGVNYDDVALNVMGEPFLITAPASGSLECGDSTPLAWQVGGSVPTTKDVRVLFSTDGGASFGETVASTPNDGAEPVTVPKPEELPSAARIKLEALGNVFFALSGPLTIADTLAPTVTAPPNLYRVECTSPEGASPDLGVAVATDLCDGALTPSDDAPDVFDFGTTTVTYTATDSSKNKSEATQTVEVVDTTPPSFITVPPDVTAECASPHGTEVDLGVPVVSDVCDDAVTVTNNAPYPPLFLLGTTTVKWTAVDNFANEASAYQAVTIVDTTPPELTLSLSPAVLWPPNHKLITIKATITVQDKCDAVPTVRLVSIASDEPDNGKGDGNTTGDIVGASIGQDDREFQLRAERSGGGDGRVYTVTYEARDASGNTTTRAATVIVPHDQGK